MTGLKLRIAIGVLVQRDRLWIQQRPAGSHLAYLWEFPGGKIEQNESPAQGLLRELQEEVGLKLDRRQLRLVWQRFFSYADRDLTLFFFLIRLRDEQPARSGHWVPISELRDYAFPEANRPVLDWLRET